jgi:hypothetical protein
MLMDIQSAVHTLKSTVSTPYRRGRCETKKDNDITRAIDVAGDPKIRLRL